MTTTKPEYLDEVGILAYKGFELERKGDAFVLHQCSFTTELLFRYPGTCQPFLSLGSQSFTRRTDRALVREFEQLAGGLCTCTSLDICLAASTMGHGP